MSFDQRNIYSHIKLLRNSFLLFFDECFVLFRYFSVSKCFETTINHQESLFLFYSYILNHFPLIPTRNHQSQNKSNSIKSIILFIFALFLLNEPFPIESIQKNVEKMIQNNYIKSSFFLFFNFIPIF